MEIFKITTKLIKLVKKTKQGIVMLEGRKNLRCLQKKGFKTRDHPSTTLFNFTLVVVLRKKVYRSMEYYTTTNN